MVQSKMNKQQVTKFYTPRSAIEKLQGSKDRAPSSVQSVPSKADLIIGNPPFTPAKSGSGK
jgi:methylase of polypeptide subunit release factors